MRDDPRYKAVKHEQRETLFNEYIAELKSAEDEVERSAKAKRDEQVSMVNLLQIPIGSFCLDEHMTLCGSIFATVCLLSV